MAVLLASLAPVLIILFYIYFRDKYDKEPLGLLLKALLMGIVIIVPVIFIERLLMNLMPQSSKVAAAAYHAFVVAGSTEELFKFLALYLLVWKSPSFDEKFDGIVYAVFVSLGFAGVENVLYVMDGGMQTALTRALTAVPAHAIFGITMGYYLGIAHMYKELQGPYLARALLVPILGRGGIGSIPILFCITIGPGSAYFLVYSVNPNSISCTIQSFQRPIPYRFTGYGSRCCSSSPSSFT